MTLPELGRKLESPSPEAIPPELLQSLRTLIGGRGGSAQSELVEELLSTFLQLVNDGSHGEDLKILLRSIKELHHAFRVFAPYRQIRKVSVFGSARTSPGEPEYDLAKEFSLRMARLGYMIITGAGGGIMEAAQGGAGRESSFGVNIRLPLEQRANPHIADDPKLIHFKYFFTRKVVFIKETNAVVLFPGGFGTHDEGFESLTLVQTGKTDPIPIVFLDRPGGSYWREWMDYVEKHLLRRRLIDEEDTSLFRVTDNLEEAIDEILGFYRNFHSCSSVGDRYTIRLQHALPDALLDELNRDFADLLGGGRFEAFPAVPGEQDPTATESRLPRLVFSFNRRSMGRLRQLIDRLNREALPSGSDL